MLQHVPVINMAGARGDVVAAHAFSRLLGQALEGIGFATLVNHGIDIDLLQRVYSLTERVFSYPDAILRRYETPGNGRQTGFASFGVEHAKTSPVGDLKRFWHVRSEGDGGVANLWPDEVPEFRSVMLQLFDVLYRLAAEIVGPLGDYLGLPHGTLESMLGRPETLLRVLHYPPVADDAQGVRSHAHEDINLITLLVAATSSGLEVKTRDGNWVAVNERPGSIVVNVGDMLQMFTGGRMVSTSHRVVNPLNGANIDRYSLPFFVHAKGDVVLDQATGLTARAYLIERLKQIGLY